MRKSYPDKRNNAPSKAKKKKRSYGKLIIVFSLLFLVLLTGIGCGFFTASMNTKDNIAEDIHQSASSQIYDIHGRELANIHATENRMPIKLNKVPQNLQNAFIAVEDVRFYEHMGVDPRGILRALWSNIRGGDIAEGGSTITQQLAKNAFLTQERTLKRKFQELILALQLERQYTKQEILELYLNQIYFGQGAYGVQAAAKIYFGKNVEDLDLNECAMLAGIPKSPNYYSPFNNLNAAQQRKAVVLDQMIKYHFIDKETGDILKNSNLNLVKQSTVNRDTASYFIDYVTQTLIEKYGADAVYKEGLKIYTTLDLDMQKAAEAAMSKLPDFEVDSNGLKQPQGALVAIDPSNGQIKAMVGGRGTDQFNRAVLAERQPGSAFKPFVFLAALENKFDANTIIEDSKISIGEWSPLNYNRKFNGKVTLRTVAEQSLNVPTVRIAQAVGVEKVISLARDMGISTLVLDGYNNDYNLAITLGGLTRGVTPLELTSAYGTFANSGVYVEPIAILKVVDRNGKTLEEAEEKKKQVISESTAAELTDLLQGVIQRGTGTGADFGRPAAGKTGTADNYSNAWFVGYTPQLVAGVWIGCDDDSDLDGMTGGNLPATIWRLFMTSAMEHYPVRSFSGSITPKTDVIKELLADGSSKKGDAKSLAPKDAKKNTSASTKKPTNKDKDKSGQSLGTPKESPSVKEDTSSSPPPSIQPATPSVPTPKSSAPKATAPSSPSPGFSGGKGKN